MSGRRVTFLLNMLSPYWIPFYLRVARSGWSISLRVANLQEPNRAYGAEIFDSVKEAGIDLAELPGWTLDLTKPPVRTDYLQLPFHLASALDRLDPHVVVSNQLGIRTRQAIAWGERRATPVIPWINASQRSERSNSRLREANRRRLVADAPRVFTNGSEGVRYVMENLYVDRRRIVEVPYAIATDEWARKVSEARAQRFSLRTRLGLSRLVILYVGQMIRRKGLWELFEALRMLPPEAASSIDVLAVGGDPPFGLRRKARKSRVRVVWHPFVQPDQLPIFLAASDALILPTLSDEWGIVLNEGAAAGLPLLASRYAGATADLFVDGKSGFLLDPENPRQMAEALERFTTLSPEQRAEMGKISQELARARDLSRTVEAAVAALDEVEKES